MASGKSSRQEPSRQEPKLIGIGGGFSGFENLQAHGDFQPLPVLESGYRDDADFLELCPTRYPTRR